MTRLESSITNVSAWNKGKTLLNTRCYRIIMSWNGIWIAKRGGSFELHCMRILMLFSGELVVIRNAWDHAAELGNCCQVPLKAFNRKDGLLQACTPPSIRSWLFGSTPQQILLVPMFNCARNFSRPHIYNEIKRTMLNRSHALKWRRNLTKLFFSDWCADLHVCYGAFPNSDECCVTVSSSYSTSIPPPVMIYNVLFVSLNTSEQRSMFPG